MAAIFIHNSCLNATILTLFPARSLPSAENRTQPEVLFSGGWIEKMRTWTVTLHGNVMVDEMEFQEGTWKRNLRFCLIFFHFWNRSDWSHRERWWRTGWLFYSKWWYCSKCSFLNGRWKVNECLCRLLYTTVNCFVNVLLFNWKWWGNLRFSLSDGEVRHSRMREGWQ